MRPLPIYMGLVWFGVWAGGVYALAGRYTRKPRGEVRRQALPLPAPSRPEPRREVADPLPEEPPMEYPAPAEEPPARYEEPQAQPEYLPPPQPEPARRPHRGDLLPALTYPAARPETPPPAPPPVPEVDDAMGRCLVCGTAIPSWVEVDGRRQGYCPRHQSRVKVAAPTYPAADRSRATWGRSSRAREETSSVQCTGTKRDGTRCRRKTRDPSGRCYQHR